MASDLQSYHLLIIDDLTFQFTTEYGDEYKCYFISYAEYFYSYPELASKVFAFNLELINPHLKHKGNDRRIAYTAVSIVSNFLSLYNAVVYICDTSDDKHLARSRKFKSWFNYYKAKNILQVNAATDIGGITLYNTLLIHKSNSLVKEFVDAFLELNNSDDK